MNIILKTETQQIIKKCQNKTTSKRKKAGLQLLLHEVQSCNEDCTILDYLNNAVNEGIPFGNRNQRYWVNLHSNLIKKGFFSHLKTNTRTELDKLIIKYNQICFPRNPDERVDRLNKMIKKCMEPAQADLGDGYCFKTNLINNNVLFPNVDSCLAMIIFERGTKNVTVGHVGQMWGEGYELEASKNACFILNKMLLENDLDIEKVVFIGDECWFEAGSYDVKNPFQELKNHLIKSKININRTEIVTLKNSGRALDIYIELINRDINIIMKRNLNGNKIEVYRKTMYLCKSSYI